jgi:hypothetical protein
MCGFSDMGTFCIVTSKIYNSYAQFGPGPPGAGTDTHTSKNMHARIRPGRASARIWRHTRSAPTPRRVKEETVSPAHDASPVYPGLNMCNGVLTGKTYNTLDHAHVCEQCTG